MGEGKRLASRIPDFRRRTLVNVPITVQRLAPRKEVAGSGHKLDFGRYTKCPPAICERERKEGLCESETIEPFPLEGSSEM